MSNWVLTKIGVKTRSLKEVKKRSSPNELQKVQDKYKDESKIQDPKKIEFNDYVCAIYYALLTYWTAIDPDAKLRAFVVDGLYLGTTTRLVKDCGMDLADIDVVSRSVEFDSEAGPNFYTSEVATFFNNKKRETVGHSKYDLVIFDITGSWPGKKRTQYKVVETIFKKDLLEDISFLEITLCFRNGAERLGHMSEIFGRAVQDIQKIAASTGYTVNIDVYKTNGIMFYLFFRVIHMKRAMSHNGGIEGVNDTYATHWFSQHTEGLPTEGLPLFPTPLYSSPFTPAKRKRRQQAKRLTHIACPPIQLLTRSAAKKKRIVLQK